MGAVPSTPLKNTIPRDSAEYLLGTLVGPKSFPLSSDFWQKLLELPLNLQWPQHMVLQACQFLAQNNFHTRHLAKLLIHLVWCLQESKSAGAEPSAVYNKAVNAAYMSSVFLKYLIENAKSDDFEELYLRLDEDEAAREDLQRDQNIENFFMRGLLSFIGMSDLSPNACLLHHELLNLMLVAMSTQLRSGPSAGPRDVHPFIDAAMIQESALVGSLVRRLLLTYITRPHIPLNSALYPIFTEGGQPGVLQRVGSAAANFVLLPYYTFNYLLSSNSGGSRNPLADSSLLVLLILIHHRKCELEDESSNKIEGNADANGQLRENSYFYDNPYCKALENARDVGFDHVDIEGSAHSGLLVRLHFASLFDTLGACLTVESSVLLLYSLVHGNSGFLEYVLVRTDLDTLLMPVLEMLYNASRRTSNQIYILLIILLILSQDSSFNASIHKLVLPSVQWYQERLVHHTTLGSLMVVILIRIVQYNLSKLGDVYLHTNCLATLANMAPHVNRLSAYASQRLVSLFDMLARKYTKLAELKNDKANSIEGGNLAEDSSTELHIYTDFLRIVLEILNAILTYALPRNPEVVYAIMHRQEVFQPFKNHPRFKELLENIYTVLDFFNNRMDALRLDGEWSVDKVLQVIIINCRSWRGEGMKVFTQLKFTYEQEHHPEEFFIPYVWQLVVSSSGFSFNSAAIHLFPADLPEEPPKPDRPFLLYVTATDDAISAALAQHDDDRRNEHVNYINKALLEYEQRYTPIEKTCLAVVHATQKLSHYLLYQPIKLLARMNPLKYLFEKSTMFGRIARWQMMLAEFDITYVTQKSIKRQALDDHLVAQPLPSYEPVRTDFPDEHFLFATNEEEPPEWEHTSTEPSNQAEVHVLTSSNHPRGL